MSDVTVVWSAGTGACWTWCPFGRRPNQWSAVDGSVSRHQWGRDKARTGSKPRYQVVKHVHRR